MITHINPVGSMDLLSQLEVDRLKQTASSDIYQLFRNCSLAVLNSGSHTDSSKEILERFKSFDIHVIRRERGVKIAVVSNKFEPAVIGLCEDYFKSLIDAAVGQTEDRQKKPAPDGVLYAMKLLGANPAETVYSGDSEVDVVTARNSKLPCIGVSWGFRDRKVLVDGGASYIADSAEDILSIME